jgi:hypothetical protein
VGVIEDQVFAGQEAARIAHFHKPPLVLGKGRAGLAAGLGLAAALIPKRSKRRQR